MILGGGSRVNVPAQSLRCYVYAEAERDQCDEESEREAPEPCVAAIHGDETSSRKAKRS